MNDPARPNAISPIPGWTMRPHTFTVPLDHDRSGGPTIEVFAREVVDTRRDGDRLPWLIFFQGGPGFGGPRPLERSGWLKRLTGEFRVLLLDARGTGRSTPIGVHTLECLPSPPEQFAYLRHFRQDAIVRDAECIRRRLLGDEPWYAYGQSFGGWCITTYLSQAPEGLAGALLTGGLPPVHRTAEELYAHTYRIVETKNDRFYTMFPQQEENVRRIADHLAAHDVRLPQGDRLTVRRFQQVGLNFYRSTGYAFLNYLLEGAWVDGPDGPQLSYAFLREIERQFPYESNPIFAVLHEPIYSNGPATRWAAHRVRARYPQFDAEAPGRVLLTGEMIYPWMFEEYRMLRPFAGVAEQIAAHDGWPPLYNPGALAQNRAPVAAAVYYDDMCVVRRFSEETARTIGNCRVWITNEYEHDGSGVDGERIIGRLLDLMRGHAAHAFA